MKNQALFSYKDKSKNENVVCRNFCLALYGLMHMGTRSFPAFFILK